MDPKSFSSGERAININGLFREGYYCVGLYLIDPNAELIREMSGLKTYKIPEKIDVSYVVEIPATGYKYEGAFLSSSENYLVPAYNEKMSYQQFNLVVENIPDYRADAFVYITYTGEESQLKDLSFRVSVSEWSCK